MAILRGYVDHIIYRNPDNGYKVISLSVTGEIPSEIEDEIDGQDRFTCTGLFPGLGEGESIEVTGEYTRRSGYGLQMDVKSYIIVAPENVDEMRRYLGSGAIRGIGEKLADRIIDRFGDDSFRIIEEEPERLAEIKGISESKARDIAVQMIEKRDLRSAVMYLSRYGITGVLALRIYRQYGTDLYKILETNPYRMAEEVRGVGFKIADDIAQRAGISVDSEYRVRSGILYVLTVASAAGSTYLPIDMLIDQASTLLRVEGDYVRSNVFNLAADRKLIIKGSEVYDRKYYRMEENAAGMLLGLDDEFAEPVEMIDKRIRSIETDEGMELDEKQREAIRCAATHGISVLTGGPGTGKTTVIRTMIRYFEQQGQEIMLAAPTGRAAKRMSEATGRESRTIHRLLEVSVRTDEEKTDASDNEAGDYSYFERNEDNPLDTDVLIIDEVSMVDISLLHSLLKAVSLGTRLILVGDIDQLPSVGPGQVLKDIIESECFPVVRLETIFRQAAESDIIKNAHHIRRGESMTIDNKSKDFFFMKRHDDKELTDVVKDLVAKKLPKYVGVEPFDIQVLTPTRKGVLGVDRLNRVLQESLNPARPGKPEQGFGERVFREGDKVMQTRNNYQIEWEIRGKYGIAVESGEGIFNGDMGVIRSIDTYESIMEIEFDEGRIVRYPFKIADELELAYAVTVHKSQGSQYPAVVIPLLQIPRLLMNRNVIYTAVTRAESCVVLVGDERVLSDMVRNEAQQVRYSGLKSRLTERVIRAL